MPALQSKQFRQIGGPGEQYHVHNTKGEPKYMPSGRPEMAWKFPKPNLEHPGNRLAGVENFAHSIEIASPGAVERGKQWYPKVHEAVAKGIKGTSLGHLEGSGIVAAVSPNMDWERNNIHAFDELKRLKSKDWDAIMAGGQGARDALKGLSVSAAGTNAVQKAGRLMRGEKFEDVFNPQGASKTFSFAHDIHDPDSHHVTIDGRALDTITNRARGWQVDRGISTKMLKTGKPTRYEQAEDIVRTVGNRFDLSGPAAQAVSWEAMKEYEQQFGRRGSGPQRVGQRYFGPGGITDRSSW